VDPGFFVGGSRKNCKNLKKKFDKILKKLEKNPEKIGKKY